MSFDLFHAPILSEMLVAAKVFLTALLAAFTTPGLTRGLVWAALVMLVAAVSSQWGGSDEDPFGTDDKSIR